MKAQKKRIIVDYFEISIDTFLNESLLKEWVNSFGDKFHEHFEMDFDPCEIKVKTLEGTSYNITDNDVIIRGIKGEYYPCKKDIFNNSYDINIIEPTEQSAQDFIDNWCDRIKPSIELDLVPFLNEYANKFLKSK